MEREAALSHDAEDDDLITIEEACRIIGGRNSPIHPATYYRNAAKGLYPAPLEMGPQIRRLSRREVMAVRERAMAARSKAGAA